jgi:hypothetical protein
MWQRMSNARRVTTLGEKIITVLTVVLLLAAGFVAFEFAGLFISIIRDFYQ